MKEKILEYLHQKHNYLSGEELSSHLGISRQGLWKHIQELKDLGYEIVAVPHLGYRLEALPDRLFAFEVTRGLKAKTMARKIYYFDYLVSTMDLAMQLGLKGAAHGTLILAESQTKGRGRLGRSWFSPKYKGIYLSLILRPQITPSNSPILTLLSAVSICEAIKETFGLEVQIKCPNDILAQNKKIAGILTEMNAEVDKVNFIVIGIGLNVNNDKKTLIAQATSLKEQLLKPVSRVLLLQAFLNKFEDNYSRWENKGSSWVIERWRSLNSSLGQRVKIYYQHKHLEGVAVDIDQDGGLLIRKDSGIMQKVTSGDVMYCRQP